MKQDERSQGFEWPQTTPPYHCITDEQAEQWHRDGYFLLKNAIPQALHNHFKLTDNDGTGLKPWRGPPQEARKPSRVPLASRQWLHVCKTRELPDLLDSAYAGDHR